MLMLIKIWGTCSSSKGRHEEAIGAYKKAIAINPNYADAYNNMGNVLKEQGKLEEAIEAYKTLLKINTNYAEAHNNMGNVLWTWAN